MGDGGGELERQRCVGDGKTAMGGTEVRAMLVPQRRQADNKKRQGGSVDDEQIHLSVLL